MKFSPVMFAAVIISGIIAALNISTTALAAVICSAAALWIVTSLLKRRADMVVFVMILGFGAGAFSAAYAVSDTKNTMVNYIGRYVTVYGVVLSPAQESGESDNYRYSLAVTKVDKHGEIAEVNERILLTTPAVLGCGDSVSAAGIIKAIPGAMNENGMDAAKYYKSQGMFTKMFSEEVLSAAEIKKFSPKVIGGRLAERIDGIIYKYYAGDTAAVLSAVLTGNTHHFSKEYNKLLELTAFKRLFHPAYLHIMLITFVFSFMSAAVPMKARKITMAVLLVFMGITSCGSVGYMRCMITAAGAVFYRLKNGSAHFPDIMAWVVVILMVSSPLLIYSAGFVMSVTAGMIVWAFVPLFREYFGFLPKLVRHTALVMLLCNVLQLPLTAYYFDGICPYAIFLPFIMTPLVTVILLSAPIVFLLNGFFGYTPIIGAYLEGALWVILRLPGFVHGLPFSEILLRVPTYTELTACVFFEFALYYYMKEKPKKAVYCGAVCAGLTAASAIGFIGSMGTADFTFVNVGQGDGALISSPMGARIIIDGGGGNAYSEYNPGERIFVPYLISKGCGEIDAAVISHFHKDHVEGIIAAVEMLSVKTVFAPAPQDNWSEEMVEYRASLEEAAAEKGTEIRYISENTRVSFDSGITLYLYAPDEAAMRSTDDNDFSLLVKAEYGETTAIYSGDISADGEMRYIKGGVDVSADIMKVGHHGSSGSTCDEWVSAVAPRLAVISCGENNSYGHPTEQTLERLSGIPVLRTDMSGTITVTADKEKIKNIYVFRDKQYNLCS